MSEIDIYPVGLLHDLQRFIHMPDRRTARYSLRRMLSTPLQHAKARDWRALKNHFNGYLAEPRHLPPGFTRCGSGWTRGRAYRDLQRRLSAITPDDLKRGI